LPLKRYRDGQLETSVLVATAKDGQPMTWLAGANIAALPDRTAMQAAPTRRPAELVADGWIVD
jgi:hypothetical protein